MELVKEETSLHLRKFEECKANKKTHKHTDSFDWMGTNTTIATTR
jgi:hypothetical protein